MAKKEEEVSKFVARGTSYSGNMHQSKTAQDRLDVEQRPRAQAQARRVEWMKKHRPGGRSHNFR